MASSRAVVVDPDAPGGLAITEVAEPEPGAGHALVEVVATSLNRGDLLAAQASAPGWIPGHDVAGTVLTAAADGSGPAAGSRVVALLDSGAWRERVVAPVDRMAVLPDSVSFAQASTLPTAGLTAHRALEKNGLLLGTRVLITGSTGGVGLFAHQLAKASGAVVIGTSRRPEREAFVRDLGADEVVLGDDLSAAREFGPFDLILESLGGNGLRAALSMIAPGGTCVTFGWSESPIVEFDLREFLAVGTGTLVGVRMYSELELRPASGDLDLLARMIADGRLQIPIDAEVSWEEIGEVGRRLIDREYTGKAVLRLGA